jgi:hypothetical protein
MGSRAWKFHDMISYTSVGAGSSDSCRVSSRSAFETEDAFPVILHADNDPAVLLCLVVERLGECDDLGVGKALGWPKGIYADFNGRVLVFYDSLRLARLHPLEPTARCMRRLVCRRAGACSFPGLGFRAPIGGRTYDNRLHNALFDYDWPAQSRQYKQSQQRR